MDEFFGFKLVKFIYNKPFDSDQMNFLAVICG